LTAKIIVLQGGQWILDLVDHFSGNFIIYILAIVEIVGIAWIYGQSLEYRLNLANTCTLAVFPPAAAFDLPQIDGNKDSRDYFIIYTQSWCLFLRER